MEGAVEGFGRSKLLYLSFDTNASRTSGMLLFVDICNNTSESTLPWRFRVCTDALLLVEQWMRSEASAKIPSENLDYASSKGLPALHCHTRSRFVA